MKKFIYIIISIVFFVAIGNSIYDQMNKKSAKSVRLECHKNSTVFEKVLKPKLVTQLQDGIKNGAISLEIEIEKAKYMDSKLFEYVDPQVVKKDFINLIKNVKNNEKNVQVNILIYENDKNDPGKKTAKSKLYAGYLVFTYKVQNKLVYKQQIDFLDHEGKDIPKVLDCGLISVLTLSNKES